MGYQSSSIQTDTRTADGTPVTWRITFEPIKSATPLVDGEPLGTFAKRSDAIKALGLVEVRVKRGKR